MLKSSIFTPYISKSLILSNTVKTYPSEGRITITSKSDLNSYVFGSYTTLEVLDYDVSSMEYLNFNVKILNFSQTITKLTTLNFHSNSKKSFEEIILCPSIITISSYCFRNFLKLKKINLENVNEIGVNAFYNTNLSLVTLSIDCICDSSFTNCMNLEEIIFTGEGSSFDTRVLKGLNKIPRISFVNNNAFVEKDYGIVNIQSKELFLYKESNVHEFQIPDEIETINPITFTYLTKPLKVIIPAKIINFMGLEYFNPKIVSIKFLSNRIYKLPDYSFANCFRLQEIVFNSKIISIGYASFANCT